jgi:hypothetical protein
MKSTSDLKSSESFEAADKWQALCTIYNIRLDNVFIELSNLAKKINLPESSPVWDQIILALNNRRLNNLPAHAVLSDLKNLINKPALSDITAAMQHLQGKFIAMFAAQDFNASTYHFYGHGKEMSEDPGELYQSSSVGNEVDDFLTATVNALGAAHDIIQSAGPPLNEQRSAAIFVTETQNMLNELMERNNYTPKTVAILEKLRDKTIPFLAEECIVNGTYLLFNSGKRDFDNILTQINQVFEKAKGSVFEPMKLSKDLQAMKTAIALADTRRSEIKSVLKKHESLSNILEDGDNKLGLEKLLQAARVLKHDEHLPNLSDDSTHAQEKLMKIEGFLLRLGQNVRMTSELAVHFAQNSERQQLIKTIRTNKPYEIAVKSHLEPFINSIDGKFGEAAFARALGTIDNTELASQVKDHHLEAMVNEDNFDFNGWESHADNLISMKQAISTMSNEEKKMITKIIYVAAAKSPGHKVSQEIFDAMINYRKELASQKSSLLTHLDENIAEITAANPNLMRHTIASGYSSPAVHSPNLFRPRVYSQINRSTPSPIDTQRNQEAKTSRLPAASYEIVGKSTRSNSVVEKNQNKGLPPIHRAKKLTSKPSKSIDESAKTENSILPPIKFKR